MFEDFENDSTTRLRKDTFRMREFGMSVQSQIVGYAREAAQGNAICSDGAPFSLAIINWRKHLLCSFPDKVETRIVVKSLGAHCSSWR